MAAGDAVEPTRSRRFWNWVWAVVALFLAADGVVLVRPIFAVAPIVVVMALVLLLRPGTAGPRAVACCSALAAITAAVVVAGTLDEPAPTRRRPPPPAIAVALATEAGDVFFGHPERQRILDHLNKGYDGLEARAECLAALGPAEVEAQALGAVKREQRGLPPQIVYTEIRTRGATIPLDLYVSEDGQWTVASTHFGERFGC